MKWVKCICSEIDGSGYANITTGKIYEVVEYVKLRPIVKIINDIGEEREVFLYAEDKNLIYYFEDVTAEVVSNNRQEKINDLLNDKHRE